MNIGMLWLDTSSETLTVKVRKATAYYQKKYGRKPEICLVHPSAISADEEINDVDGVAVRPWRGILPRHLWIGVEDVKALVPAEEVPA